ncbi:DUF1800 domain-containing protein [Arsenicicoccus sp. oral taxon 190]|uniref:DUF1800 domain-containing protein n=1 Tax=Arsenicicoccus sp. oral taxon 190 TaxID=1658671 RepID=UPI00067A4048|nr:DUF1800 family protein [Arsenicicoccus sp. oral taxon 190]AKT52135.1 hypothetical protein ADJ73_14155 [Arsenicicoccus sp. oral taxon 190]
MTSAFAASLPLRTTPAWHLARRAAQAPTAAIVADIERLGTRAWLDQQLDPGRLTDPAWDAIVQQSFAWLPMTSKQVDDVTGGQGFRGGPVMAHAQAVRPLFTTKVLWENVVTMWGDLLYVPYRSKADAFVLEYDWAVLRRHAFGRYADLLHAAVTHPAILRNLDNDVSSADNPNENLGRELLELYTVGVGSYTETDVRQSALLLTGHSIDWTTRTYRFDRWAHHVGPVKVMGFSHPNGSADGGPAVLRAYTDYLARHPRTARHVAQVIATRFVSDTPSESLLQTLASTYLAADTAIVPVLRRLFDHPEFWSSVGAKWSRPAELCARSVRAAKPTGYSFEQPITSNPWAMSNYFWFLYECGHAPRDWPRVDGYPDTALEWRTTIATLSSWNMTHSIAWGWGDGPSYPAQVDPKDTNNRPRWDLALQAKLGDNVLATARRITRDLTGYTWRDQDIAPIASWLCSYGDRPATATDVLSADALTWWLPEAVRLVLASPYSFLR